MEGSEDGERWGRLGLSKEDVAGALFGRGMLLVEVEFRCGCGDEVLRGEGDGCRSGGCASRESGFPCAIVVEGPALPESGFSGVEALDWGAESGGRRDVRVEVLTSVGSCGSMAMAPSF